MPLTDQEEKSLALLKYMNTSNLKNFDICLLSGPAINWQVRRRDIGGIGAIDGHFLGGVCHAAYPSDWNLGITFHNGRT